MDWIRPLPTAPDRPDSDGNTVDIFTDGACLGNPGPGGWGANLGNLGSDLTGHGFGQFTAHDERFERHVLDQDVMTQPIRQIVEKLVHLRLVSATIAALHQRSDVLGESDMLASVDIDFTEPAGLHDLFLAGEMVPAVRNQRIENQFEISVGVGGVADFVEQVEDAQQRLMVGIKGRNTDTHLL